MGTASLGSPATPSVMFTATLRSLNTAIDEYHALFSAWLNDDRLATVLDRYEAEIFRLALHEWIANLVQHAQFSDAPLIRLTMTREADGIHCVVEDNSEGFDFARQVEKQQAILDAPGPSERGRGLLMLITCVRDLTYEPLTENNLQRLSFRVPPPDDTDHLASLFSSALPDSSETTDSSSIADFS